MTSGTCQQGSPIVIDETSDEVPVPTIKEDKAHCIFKMEELPKNETKADTLSAFKEAKNKCEEKPLSKHLIKKITK